MQYFYQKIHQKYLENSQKNGIFFQKICPKHRENSRKLQYFFQKIWPKHRENLQKMQYFFKKYSQNRGKIPENCNIFSKNTVKIEGKFIFIFVFWPRRQSLIGNKFEDRRLSCDFWIYPHLVFLQLFVIFHWHLDRQKWG